jgi:hypothetical protein
MLFKEIKPRFLLMAKLALERLLQWMAIKKKVYMEYMILSAKIYSMQCSMNFLKIVVYVVIFMSCIVKKFTIC